MKEKIKEIIQKNLNGYHLEKVILFGSRARGDNDSKSDYDLYIILKEELDHAARSVLMDELSEKLAEEEICADVLISTQKSFEVNKGNSDNVAKYVYEEGILL
jgi:predicted nucleotidyltransferase